MKYFKNGYCIPYKDWESECSSISEPSFDLLATGVGGILYPKDILKMSDDDLTMIQKALLQDDIFLKYKENMLKVKVCFCSGKNKHSYKNGVGYAAKYALCFANVIKNDNDKAIRELGLKKI